MKRAVLAVLCVALAAACGSDSPAAPTRPTFPSLIGTWSGTMTIIVNVAGIGGSNTCSHTWLIANQTQGRFSGTFQLSGGTTTGCAQAGNLTGDVGVDGRLTNVAFSVAVGGNPACTRLAGDGLFVGLLSGGTLNASTTEQMRCLGVDGTRNLTLILSK